MVFLYGLVSSFKYIIMRFICLLVIGCSLGFTEVNAQSYSVGMAGVYGDDIEEPGVNLRAYYNLKNERICFGPEFTLFKTGSKTLDGEDEDISLFELNFNMHYIFELTHRFGVYPLVGINFSKETAETETIELKEEKWGANLGMGVHYAIGKVVLFTEYDHLFSDLSQNSYLVGFFLTFGNKEAEEPE